MVTTYFKFQSVSYENYTGSIERDKDFYLPNSCHGNESPPKALPRTADKGRREFHWVLVTILH